MKTTDILIAGGGIGGAVLAALLVRGGKRVMIVERATGPPPFLRPELLWPAAVRVLEEIRPLEFWERESVRRAGGITLVRGGRRQVLADAALFEAAGVQPYFEHPNNLRETMLALCGAEVHRGVEVTGLLRSGGRVTGATVRTVATGATRKVEAALTVGDDGGHSVVPNALGIPCRLKPFPLDFIAAEQPWPAAWPADEVRLYFPAHRMRGGLLAFAAMPLPGNVAACLGVVPSETGDDGLAEDFRSLVSGADVPPALTACGFPAGFRRIGREWGHAESYGAPGAVLIGDAIHPVSPAGGQGANMAIGDAAALARIILAGGRDPAAALERVRRARNERGVRPSRLAARIAGGRWLPGNFLLALITRWRGLRVRALRALGGE
jgi:2-polyprenyl-6-methoxyphenol hydroxylase-like FAD-dependent oxidoreductase